MFGKFGQYWRNESSTWWVLVFQNISMWGLSFSARWLLHFAFWNSVQERRLGELRWMLRRASLACRCRRWGWGRRPGWTLSGRKRPRPASQHLISRWRCSRGHGWWRIQEMSWKLSCCCSSQLHILTSTVPCHHIEEKENCRNNKHWKLFCKRGTFHAKQLLQRSTLMISTKKTEVSLFPEVGNSEK